MTGDTNYDALFTGRSVVSFAPCGCWMAVQLEYRDFRERAQAASEFLIDAQRSGSERVEEMSHDEWRSLRNGVSANLEWGCDHDPQWGGAVRTHAECPRCWKDVQKNKDGSLRSHKAYGFTCSQVPFERSAATA